MREVGKRTFGYVWIFFSVFRVDNTKNVRGCYLFAPLVCQERKYLVVSLQNCDKIIKLERDPLGIEKHISQLTALEQVFYRNLYMEKIPLTLKTSNM